MAMTAEEVLARQIKRNVVLGIAFCFVLTVVMCLPSGIGWRGAMSVALLPAGFAGPFVGGLACVVSWVRTEDRSAAANVAVEPHVVAVAVSETGVLPVMTQAVDAPRVRTHQTLRAV